MTFLLKIFTNIKTQNIFRAIVPAVVAVLTILMTECSNNDSPEPPSNNAVHRTLLVYMVAANNLGDNGLDDDDIKEMQQAVSQGHLQGGRLLVYLSTRALEAVLYEVTSTGMTQLKNYAADGNSSVSVTRMSQVLKDAKSLAPSQEFGLILWSHGTGWIQSMSAVPSSALDDVQPLTWGSDAGKTMNVTDLSTALESVHPDFVYFDCCLMNSIEVAYQLRNATSAIVGSAAELPAGGMPYQLSLKPLFNTDKADLNAAAEATYKYYNSLPNDYERNCTMSVINTDALGYLASVVTEIVAATPSLNPLPAVNNNSGALQSYVLQRPYVYYDAYQYYSLLASMATDSDKATQLQNKLDQAWEQAVTYTGATERIYLVYSKTNYRSIPVNVHSGLSCYIPLPGDNNFSTYGYSTLDWPNVTGIMPRIISGQ